MSYDSGSAPNRDAEPKALAHLEVWFVAGSQGMYGPETLAAVESQWREIAAAIDAADAVPVRIVARGVVTSADSIARVCRDANADDGCAGLMVWMHTFSPAGMWIGGLSALRKPLLHLHTQYNERLPWSEIDMGFMNLNQSAHGDREFGYIATRMRLRRKTIAGHWRHANTLARIGVWCRAACGWHEAQQLRVARFGDNMRRVAVTDGDKVDAQIRLGVAVDGYGVGDLVETIASIPRTEVDEILDAYDRSFAVSPALQPGGTRRDSLVDAAHMEAGLRSFLSAGGYQAFTDTFEDLHGLPQLPGIAVQRLMADGFGFGAEGDWKTAALVRIVKVMGAGLTGGTSFMEDYTYDLTPGAERVLGAHMLEVCPSIATERPSCEAHPLSIGNRQDPVRLVFTAAPGPAVVVGMNDLGSRFRLVANEIEVVPPNAPLPKLPVARAVWEPKPDFFTATEAWLAAGGPHHTVFTSALGLDAFVDLAAIAGIELVAIDRESRLEHILRELRWNEPVFGDPCR